MMELAECWNAVEERETMGSWARLEMIGSGSFGRVHRAEDADTKASFAVKSVALAESPSADHSERRSQALDSLENEIEILSELQSDNIVRYLGDDWTSEEEETSFRNLHLELVSGGSLSDLIKRQESGRLAESHAQQYTLDLLNALQHVHSRGIVHADVKGSNVLIADNGRAKLADFGAAFKAQSTEQLLMAEGEEGSSSSLGSLRGTVQWMSPEVAGEEQNIGTASDIWSLGCTLIEMLTGRPAWTAELLHKNLPRRGTLSVIMLLRTPGNLPRIPGYVSTQAKDFLDCCLRRNPAERWTAENLLLHPFVSSVCCQQPSSVPSTVEVESALPLPFLKIKTLRRSSSLKRQVIESESPRSPTSPFGFLASSSYSSDSETVDGSQLGRKKRRQSRFSSCLAKSQQNLEEEARDCPFLFQRLEGLMNLQLDSDVNANKLTIEKLIMKEAKCESIISNSISPPSGTDWIVVY